MSQLVQRAVLGAVLLCSVALPARADVTADVQTKIDGAMKSAKSYVVMTSFPAQAYASTFIYVAPDRSRVTVAISANTTDVVRVGDTSYTSKNGTAFEKAAVAPQESARRKPIGSVKVGAIRTDITAGGTTYGAFDTSVALGIVVTLTCMYDKKTYRLARCANTEVTQSYSNYDDPQNIVETPKNIVEAPKEAPKVVN